MKNKIISFVRNYDGYGHPINLNYRRSQQYKTLTVGAITHSAHWGIMAYFLILLSQVISKENF